MPTASCLVSYMFKVFRWWYFHGSRVDRFVHRPIPPDEVLQENWKARRRPKRRRQRPRTPRKVPRTSAPPVDSTMAGRPTGGWVDFAGIVVVWWVDFCWWMDLLKKGQFPEVESRKRQLRFCVHVPFPDGGFFRGNMRQKLYPVDASPRRVIQVTLTHLSSPFGPESSPTNKKHFVGAACFGSCRNPVILKVCSCVQEHIDFHHGIHPRNVISYDVMMIGEIYT